MTPRASSLARSTASAATSSGSISRFCGENAASDRTASSNARPVRSWMFRALAHVRSVAT